MAFDELERRTFHLAWQYNEQLFVCRYNYELEAAVAKAKRLFEHEPISLQELQEAVFEIRDRLWAGEVETEPAPPLRLRG